MFVRSSVPCREPSEPSASSVAATIFGQQLTFVINIHHPRSIERRLPDGDRSGLRSGAAAVEMAIVLPIVLTIVFACFDYGRAISGKIALTNVARVGAEYGATHRFVEANRAAWESRVREAATDEAASLPGYRPTALTLDIDATYDTEGVLYIVVAAVYEFRTIVPWPGMPRTLELSHQVGMRQYQ